MSVSGCLWFLGYPFLGGFYRGTQQESYHFGGSPTKSDRPLSCFKARPETQFPEANGCSKIGNQRTNVVAFSLQAELWDGIVFASHSQTAVRDHSMLIWPLCTK